MSHVTGEAETQTAPNRENGARHQQLQSSMPGRRIVIDGLWQCLYPLFNGIGLLRINQSSRRVVLRTHIGDLKWSNTSSLKYLHTRSLHSEETTPGSTKKDIPRAPDISSFEAESRSAIKFRNRNWDDLSTTELHDLLRKLKHRQGTYLQIVELVKYILKKTGERPSLLHYDVLVSGNADATHGSADVVATLLRDIQDRGIPADSGIYHSGLQALAVHPNYVLRSEILREMNERWFTLNNDGWHNLLVGLLRDRQYEMALDKLEKRQHDMEAIQPWLYDIFIYLFCEAQEFDEALKILNYRVENADIDISPNIWYAVLDVCSRNFHHEGTLYVWSRRVDRALINPPDGLCMNVLNTAARHRDASLATSVIRVLAGRKSKIEIHHYEALLDTYIGSNDLNTALRLLIIMKKARLEPEEGTTRPIHTYLTTSQELPAEAWEELQSLHKDGHDVPVSAVNCVLEAFVSTGQHEEALKRYKELDTVCSSPPNTATINTLLKNLVKIADSKEIAMFLASEMASLGIMPNLLTFDRLILVCLNEQDYEDAFRYMDEMKAVFPRSDLRPGTAHALISVCAEAQDERGWTVLNELEEKGRGTAKMRSIMNHGWRTVVSE